MSPFLVLSFSLIAALSTLLGGILPLLKKEFSKLYLSILVAMSAGILLAASFHEVIGESFRLLFPRNSNLVPIGVGIGFLLFYLIEKAVIIHACPEVECEIHPTGWLAFSGLSFHSLIDGIALSAGFSASTETGLIILLALAIHEFPEGLSTASVMLCNGYNRKIVLQGTAIVGFLTPIGTLIGLFFVKISPQILGLTLAISAGTFIYIATSDLLPEAHQRFRSYWVIASTIFGYLSVLLISLLFSH